MDLKKLPYHPLQEKLVDILVTKTQNNDRAFFRLMVAYNFAKVASMMHCLVQTPKQDMVPVNMYGVNLAPSGFGKGHSMKMLKNKVISNFASEFLNKTLPSVADQSLHRIGVKRANVNQSNPDTETEEAKLQYEDCGDMLFAFSSATSAAIYQGRTKILLGGAGSLNLEIDEIGSNLEKSMEAFNVYMELYDNGYLEEKMVKNTRDNKRVGDLTGRSPANMMLFGTPLKLMDNSTTEKAFKQLLDTGYARRCFFNYSQPQYTKSYQSPQEVLDSFRNQDDVEFLTEICDEFGLLAAEANYRTELKMQDSEFIHLLDYSQHCDARAQEYSEYEEMYATEMRGRDFKVMKLAAAYAFVDGEIYVKRDHIDNAIRMAEDSGEALHRLLHQDKAYMRLADYITGISRPVTRVDLVEDLPFYTGAENHKRELMDLAIAHGYNEGMYITREIIDGIEFFHGKRLPKTDLSKLRVSWSRDMARGYKPEYAPFDQLEKLCCVKGLHWATHHFEDEHRHSEKVIEGTNLVVLDVDKNVSLDAALLLLEDYKFFWYTTKRHTEEQNRFRIVMPLSHTLKLERDKYKEFMQNVYDWLPFKLDDSTNQPERKWLSHNGKYGYNDGKLLPALEFIPKTKKAEERRKRVIDQAGLNNLERWFVNNTENGNRNNMLWQYAACLCDMGYDPDSMRYKVLSLNSRLPDPLEESEVLSTVVLSVTNRINNRNKPE